MRALGPHSATSSTSASGTAAVVFVFSLVFVFLILAAQYESWSLPVSVCLSVPTALLGLVAAVMLRGMENNVYTFVVAKEANKIEIGHAVEKLWDVKVENVRTMVYAGKDRRALMGRMSRNRNVGRRPSYKKAMVTLAEGDHIEFYEVG